MKILFLAENYPLPATTGMRLISSQLLAQLDPSKFEIDLWYLGLQKPEVFGDFPCVKNSQFFKINPQSLMSYYFSGNNLPWGLAKYHSAALVQKLARTDLRDQFDLVYLDSPFLAAYQKYFSNIPIILNSVDDIQAWFSEAARIEKKHLKKLHFQQELKKYAAFEKNNFSKFSKLIFVADKDRLGVVARGLASDKTITIPLGVDTDYFQPQTEKTSPQAIITTGNMAYLPNQRGVKYFAQNIWPLLKHDLPGLTWYIVGQDPAPEIQQLMQDKNIIVTGFVEDIREYFAQAQVVVSPIISGTGTKIKILEALSMGKAIVASPKSIDGLPELTGSELLVAKTPAEYRDFIKKLLTDARVRAEYQARARQFILKNYSWEKSITKYEQTFTNLAQQ